MPKAAPTVALTVTFWEPLTRSVNGYVPGSLLKNTRSGAHVSRRRVSAAKAPSTHNAQGAQPAPPGGFRS